MRFTTVTASHRVNFKCRPQKASIDRLEPRTLFTTFVVTNLDNTGLGSLRTSIMRANQSFGPDVITFAPA